ncbi:MAG: CoA transferase [Mycobacterium sp.]
MSALNGVRIVELAQTVAGEYCGKLLADLGAEVIKVEPPGRGSPTRSMAPIVGERSGSEHSGLFAYLNTNKRSVALDVSGDLRTLHQLIDTADAVVDDHDERWARDVQRRHPNVVFCSVTPYGHGAPPELRRAKSLNVFHSSGWGYHTPTDADPARPPLKGPGRFLVDYDSALDAAVCTASSLFRRLHTGRGEFIDVSQQAVMVSRADCILGRFITGEIAPENSRRDYDQQGPAACFECADGFVYLYMTSGKHWAGLKHLMGRPDWLESFEDDWLEFGVTPEKVAAFRRGFAAWVRHCGKESISERAQQLSVPLVPVNDAAALHRSPQYRHRAFFQQVEHPVLGRASYPTVPYRLSASPARIDTPAPSLGQHTAEVLTERHLPPVPISSQLKPPKIKRGGPLEGVRVIELTKVWAGPYAGKLLAFLGAEVIKVESCGHPDEMRAYGGTDVNHAPFFLSINPEILSVELDLGSGEHRQQLRDLITHSDIVLNNLRPGAMERLGLGYQQLAALKPDVISVSIKMWGNDGPLGYQTGYAPCFAALSGLASIAGYEGGPPLGANMRYGDSTVGAAAAFAAVAALIHRDLTGQGQFVDVSAVETLSSMIGDCLLEADLTGQQLGPDGNRNRDLAPHGCYPCSGDSWISIAVADDAEWGRLCATLDAPALAHQGRDAPAVDDRISELTRRHDAGALAQTLRSAGVSAAKSAKVLDVISDRLLWDRGFYRFVSDHREGQRPILAAPWRMSDAPALIERGAPDLGEHTDYVLGDILGVCRP